jgi:hypothetical protein
MRMAKKNYMQTVSMYLQTELENWEIPNVLLTAQW